MRPSTILGAAVLVAATLLAPAAHAKASGVKAAGPKKMCAQLSGKLRGLQSQIESRQKTYLKKMRCSIDAWDSYRKQRQDLLKIRGIARKAARKAVADLDRRNSRLRKMRGACQQERQKLDKLVGSFNQHVEAKKSELSACHIAASQIESTFKRDFRPIP